MFFNRLPKYLSLANYYKGGYDHLCQTNTIKTRSFRGVNRMKKVCNSRSSLLFKNAIFTHSILIGSLALLVILSLTGCAIFGKSTPVMKFIIYSESDANDGQPFYIMIRIVNEGSFFTDSYQDASNMVFANPPIQDVLAANVVLPGKKCKIRVSKPSKKPVAIYCIFTNPGDQWKVMLSQPLKNKYKVHLEQNAIRRID